MSDFAEYRLLDAGIEMLPGSGDDLRSGAAVIRSTIPALRSAASAGEGLTGILTGEQWTGAAFCAFVQARRPREIHKVALNAVEAMEEAALGVDRLAAAHDRHQDQLRWCRRELEAEQASVTQGGDPERGVWILDEADRIHQAHRSAESELADMFDRLDDKPILATPPASIGSRVAGAADGVWDGAWDVGVGLVEGVTELAAMAAVFMNPVVPLVYLGLHHEEYVDAFQYAIDDPGDFAVAVGAGLIDLKTWRESPAKWFGHLIPDIALTLMTAGGGTAAKAATVANKVGDTATSITTTARAIDRGVDAADAATDAARAADAAADAADTAADTAHVADDIVDAAETVPAVATIPRAGRRAVTADDVAVIADWSKGQATKLKYNKAVVDAGKEGESPDDD